MLNYIKAGRQKYHIFAKSLRPRFPKQRLQLNKTQAVHNKTEKYPVEEVEGK